MGSSNILVELPSRWATAWEKFHQVHDQCSSYVGWLGKDKAGNTVSTIFNSIQLEFGSHFSNLKYSHSPEQYTQGPIRCHDGSGGWKTLPLNYLLAHRKNRPPGTLLVLAETWQFHIGHLTAIAGDHWRCPLKIRCSHYRTSSKITWRTRVKTWQFHSTTSSVEHLTATAY